MENEDSFGLYDLGYEPLYQLLRMTLLAKTTTPVCLDDLAVEDYRILHLMHSGNQALQALSDTHAAFSPGLRRFIGSPIHDIWKDLLAEPDKGRFLHGFWDQAVQNLPDSALKAWIMERYVE